MDPREQLLQSLMRDLEGVRVPELYSADEQAKIMSKRKGQADIDAGRAAIAANARAYNEAVSAKGDLQKRIGVLTNEVEGAKTRAKQDDPVNQAIQYGKSVGVPVAAYGAGHVGGSKVGAAFDIDPEKNAEKVRKLAETLRGIDKTAPASKAQASAIVNTYDKMPKSRGLTQFGAPAVLGLSSLATQAGADHVEDPYLKEGLNVAANAERAGAGGMMFQQVIDTLRNKTAVRDAIDPTDTASIESARRQINEGGKFDRLQGPIASAAETARPTIDITPERPPVAAPPAPPALPPPDTEPSTVKQRNSDRLISTAKGKGLPEGKLEAAAGKLTKGTAAEHLLANINDGNRGAVAKALGVANGPNLQSRLVATIKEMAAKPGASAIFAGVLGASMALSDEAEAADGSGRGVGDRVKDAAVTGGAGAGLGYGGARLAQAIPALAKGLMATGEASAPASIDAMTNYSPDDYAEGGNLVARYAPALRHGSPGLEQAYDMAQVPERAPPGEPEAYYDAAAGEMPEDPAAAQLAQIQGKLAQERKRRMAMALASGDVAARAPAPPPAEEPMTRSYARRLMGALGL